MAILLLVFFLKFYVYALYKLDMFVDTTFSKTNLKIASTFVIVFLIFCWLKTLLKLDQF